MRTPGFWQRRGIASSALLPVSALYRAVRRARLRGIVPKALPVPVICVGNLTAGGAGKTPVVIALLERLRATGMEAQCISRGYGGSLIGPVRVRTETHRAAEVGDEPLLIARIAPCWIAKRRLSAATAAVLDGAKLILMDDGLQNPTLHKDLSLLVVDGGYGFGNRRTLPAGPLRETPAEGLAKTQAVVMVGEDATGVLSFLPPALPMLHARLVPAAGAERFRGRKLLAFAGIGRPEKFFATLRELGAELAETVSFADHYSYRTEDLATLARRAEARGATLVTTEKDAVRVPEAFRANVEALPVRLVFEDEAALDALLAPFIGVTQEVTDR